MTPTRRIAGGSSPIGFALALAFAFAPTPGGRVAAAEPAPVPPPAAVLEARHEPIDVTLFGDSIAHWLRERGRGVEVARFSPEQVEGVAWNLIAWQNPDGGWPKNQDWLARETPAEALARVGKKSLPSTFDNRNVYPQIRYLSEAYRRFGRAEYRAAAERALDHLLAEQRPSGGWRGADTDAITFNDDVQTGIMHLLLDVDRGAPEFDWLDPERRAKAKAALDRAIDVVARCQIVRDGAKTGWCQQHDHETLAPAKARAYELPSIGGAETASVVRFLMRIERPSPAIVEAIESAVAWLDASKIEGIRVDTVAIDPVVEDGETFAADKVVVADPSAPPIWARYYEIETNRPFFCNRDGVKVDSLAKVRIERRNGYAWYGRWAESLLAEEYPKWKARILARADGTGTDATPAPTPTPYPGDDARSREARERMVERQIAGRGVKDARALAAMRAVPRHLFVPENLRASAYADSPLPIGHDQTISQPYIVALMTELLAARPGERVLEIGTGSGYQAAILAATGVEVDTIEIVEPLAARAKETIERLGFSNVRVRAGDGYKGWPERAPYDAVIVTCAPEAIPAPLVEQLKPGGRICIPVGPQSGAQTLLLLRKGADGTLAREFEMPVRFVPMTGEAERRR